MYSESWTLWVVKKRTAETVRDDVCDVACVSYWKSMEMFILFLAS